MNSAPTRPLRFLALGDSYTIGEGVSPGERWPEQLVELLRADGSAGLEAPTVIARTGWTTDELAHAIDESSVRGPFDLVSLLIGVNNQYRGRPLDEFRPQFRALLDRSVSFAGGLAARVVVVSIPDWGVTPFARNRDRVQIGLEIDAFNVVVREEAALGGAAFVDVTTVSRTAASNPESVGADGLHPSARLYRQWAELVLPVAAAILA